MLQVLFAGFADTSNVRRVVNWPVGASAFHDIEVGLKYCSPNGGNSQGDSYHMII